MIAFTITAQRNTEHATSARVAVWMGLPCLSTDNCYLPSKAGSIRASGGLP
jgi:hypothetical protein